MTLWVPECVDLRGHTGHGCVRSRSQRLAAESPTTRLAVKPPGVHFIDMSEYFCNERDCLPVIGNVFVYIDNVHVSAAYARSLAPMLWRKIRGPLAERESSDPD